MRENMKQRIERLKKEKDAVLLAHYYVNDEVQEVADYIGDSYYLAEIATRVPEHMIVFCGVSFMGESAKILNPEKKVVMAERYADCPMAHMVSTDKIKSIKERYPDVAVVCYVNSTAEIKTQADVCVTSSNALKIVEKLPNKNIFFIPDNNLGRYIAKQIPEKRFIFNDGYCHVHKGILVEDIQKSKEQHPDALILAHPECTQEVLSLSDYVGSTSQIIDYATNSDHKEFLVCTEMGVFHELKRKNPEKQFYPVNQNQTCPDMKRITLESIVKALEGSEEEVLLSDKICTNAHAPLKRMLELARDTK